MKHLKLRFVLLAGSLFATACGVLDGPRPKNTALSPDGKTIAISHQCSFAPMQITLIDVDSRKRIGVIRGPDGQYADGPSFSSDGTLIAFTSGVPDDVANGIYVFNRRTSAIEKILYSELPNGFPRFSPDGKRIGFMRAGYIRPKSAARAVGSPKVFEVNLETGDVRQLTYFEMYGTSGFDYLSNSRILVDNYEYSAQAIVSLDALNIEKITLVPRRYLTQAHFVRVALDTGAIYYIARSNKGESGRYKYDVFKESGDVDEQTTDTQSYTTSLSVSRDGSIIGFLAENDSTDGFELWVKNVTTGATSKFTWDEYSGCQD